MLTIERPQYQLDYPRSPRLLDKLYELDCQAYGRHAVKREVLERWVSQNPMAITILMDGQDIAGAFGFLPLSERQCRLFIGGQIGEADLDCLPEDSIGCKFWYWSGLVVAPQYRKVASSPLKRLLMLGIDEWLAAQRRDHQLTHVYSAGCSNDGEQLLERFKFEKIIEAEHMADDAPLYYRSVRDTVAGRNDLLGFFRGTERQSC
jgi:hypothetical protein